MCRLIFPFFFVCLETSLFAPDLMNKRCRIQSIGVWLSIAIYVFELLSSSSPRPEKLCWCTSYTCFFFVSLQSGRKHICVCTILPKALISGLKEKCIELIMRNPPLNAPRQPGAS